MHKQNLGYRVSETIDARVAVNGRGPPRSGGRDSAKRVVSDTLYPKFCGWSKKKAVCFVILRSLYNFAANSERKRKNMRLQGLIIIDIIIPDNRCERA